MREGYLVLEDGTAFPGRAVGAPGVAAGEACFTTAMAGYEEATTASTGAESSPNGSRRRES
jgi:carbamoyl-phosphate synthase small subunit